MENELINNQGIENIESAEQKPQSNTTLPQKKKINKKLTIIFSIIILLVASIGFYYYYKNYATGTLKIVSKTKGIKIQIDGQEYNDINNIKISLKPDVYILIAYKENYLESYYQVTIKPLKKNNLEISLSNIQNVLDLDLQETTVNGSAFLTFSADEKNILYYDNFSIQKIELASKQKSVVANLDFIKDKIVEDIRWSPKSNKIIIKALNPNSEKFWIYDISTKDTEELNDKIQDICWINDEKIAYLYQSNDAESLNISNINMQNWQKIQDVPPQSRNLTCSPLEAKIAYFSPENNNVLMSIIATTGNPISSNFINNDLNIPMNVKWSFNGQKTIYKFSGEENLYLLDIPNNKIERLDIKSNNKNFVWVNNQNSIFSLENISISANINKIVLSRFDLPSKKNTAVTQLNYSPLINLKDMLINKDNTKIYILNNKELLFFDSSTL